MAKTNLKAQKRAKAAFTEIFDNPASVLVIHYSCESFYDRPRGDSPRITSIAIRRLDSAQTTSFSIHQVAELHQADLVALEANYDAFEREMLDGYFQFIQRNERARWLHWNMRDINYGFAAIEHRYRVLGGIPTIIDDDRKYDLARLLIELYGPDYTGHPRLETLMDLNHISRMAFKSGREEANAFENRDYVSLHQSTLRKVDVLGNIATRQNNKSLKTRATWRAKNGSSVRGTFEYLVAHPVFVIVFVIGAAIATFLGLYISLR